jgi:hypothetical protein
MRIGGEPRARLGNAHAAQQLGGARFRRVAPDAFVRVQRQAHLRADRQHRIERGRGVLEHHRNPPAAQAAQLALPQADEFATLELDRARNDPPRRVDQTQDRKARDRLARSGLAHQPDDLPRMHVERHAVDRLYRAGGRREMRREPADFQQRAHRFSLGFNWSRTRSPTKLIATISTISATPG